MISVCLAWDIIGCVVSGKSATFSCIVSIDVETALLVLDCTQSLASVTCFSQWSQDVRMNFFCVDEFLCCNSVSSPMSAIYSCYAIRLQHVLRLSDCPTSFTLLILLLPLLLMLYVSTLRWCIRHHSSVEKSAELNKIGLCAGPRFDSGQNPVNSNQWRFEPTDPQARVLNYCFQ